MAFDEGLAERIRSVVEGERGVSEKRMFGGVAFLQDGKMFAGLVKDDLMVRVSPDEYASLLEAPHARAMDFTGRPMKGFLFVSAPGVESDADLEAWVGRGVSYASSLPPKAAKKRA